MKKDRQTYAYVLLHAETAVTSRCSRATYHLALPVIHYSLLLLVHTSGPWLLSYWPKSAASKNVFWVLQPNKASDRKMVLNKPCSCWQALQLWFWVDFWMKHLYWHQKQRDTPKIQNGEIVDTHFHGFCRFVPLQAIPATLPTTWKASCVSLGQ